MILFWVNFNDTYIRGIQLPNQGLHCWDCYQSSGTTVKSRWIAWRKLRMPRRIFIIPFMVCSSALIQVFGCSLRDQSVMWLFNVWWHHKLLKSRVRNFQNIKFLRNNFQETFKLHALPSERKQNGISESNCSYARVNRCSQCRNTHKYVFFH